MYELVSDPGLVPEGVEESVADPKSSSDPSNIDLLERLVTVRLSLGVEMALQKKRVGRGMKSMFSDIPAGKTAETSENASPNLISFFYFVTKWNGTL